MSDYKGPKSTRGRISVKGFTIGTLDTLIKAANEANTDTDNQLINEFGELKILFMTPMGFIRGKISDIDYSDNDLIKKGHKVGTKDGKDIFSYRLNWSAILKNRDENIKQFEENNKEVNLVDNTVVFVIKDAILNPTSNPAINIKIDEFLLFADQVIGVSLSTDKAFLQRVQSD